jgi:hypothetical protein
MDPIRNPYVPNAGAAPPTLPGRSHLIDVFNVALERVRLGRPARSLLPYGLRGVGKTVLLRRFVRVARAKGYLAGVVEADDRADFIAALSEQLRRILYELDTPTAVQSLAKRAMRIFKSFTIKCGLDGLSVDIGVDAERGFADSGDISIDLGTLLISIGEAARAQDTAVLIAIDEVQYVSKKVLGALVRAIHLATQESLPILVVATGLPQILENIGDAKSYAERLFDFQKIGPLDYDDAREALVAPASEEGVVFDEDAVARIFEATRGYPYFLQEWAYRAWDVASNDRITLEDARVGETIALPMLDNGFFSVRNRRCTVSERHYLRAMAELGEGPYAARDVAALLGKKPTGLSVMRDRLIKKGMVYSEEYGSIAFTVPLFDAYMRRVEPAFVTTR